MNEPLNMETFRKVWPVMALLLCFIRNRGCQSSGFCNTAEPVAKVCTTDSLISNRSVFIDTVSVPQFAIITCKCVISTSGINETFVFVYTGSTDHTWFKLNEHYLNETNKKADINYEAELTFFTTNNSTSAEGCLNVYTDNEASFNITCFRSTNDKTTDSVGMQPAYTSSRINSVTESEVEEDVKTESETDIIIPVVAATTGSGVCIAGVIALVVVCRRRSRAGKEKSKTSTAVVKKEKEDDYYMTENPMYNVTDAEQNIQSDEREYHHIEAENQGGGMPDCQYESIRDSVVIGQIHDKRDDLHYDYTTCTSLKNGHMLGNKVNQNNIKQTKVSEQESKLTEGDTMYDRTDTSGAKSFLNVNDYHHISPAASRKGTAMNTYDTCGDNSNARIT